MDYNGVWLRLRLLVFLALGLLAPTFPVQALAQSNDITFSLGEIPSQSSPGGYVLTRLY